MFRQTTLRNGFALPTSLLLLIVIFVLGVGFLAKRISSYRGAVAAQTSSQAKQAALAGMEDVRVKLDKDYNFPPESGPGQELFTYSESLNDLAGTSVGGYRVTVDRHLQKLPYAVIRVRSEGWSGLANEPKAQHRIYAELDVSQLERGTNTPNPNLYRWINWLDGGP